MRNNKWKQIEERVVFSNKYLTLRNDLVERPDGSTTDYIVIEGKDFVTVLCYTLEKKIILTRQYLYPWGMETWTAAGGVIDQGETPEEAAIREVKEETGYDVKKIIKIGLSRTSFLNIAKNHLFFVKVDNEEDETFEDPNEIIRIREFSMEEIQTMIEKGEIIHSSTLLAINLSINKKLI